MIRIKNLLKYVLISLVFTPLLLFAEVKIEFSGDFTGTGQWMAGPKPVAYNNTEAKWEIIGWRFSTKDVQWDKLTGDQEAQTTIEQIDGRWVHEARVSRPDLRLLVPNGTNPVENFLLDYAGMTVESGLDGNPRDVAVLLKLYDKGVMGAPPIGEPPVDPAKVTEYIAANPNYYKEDYRYIDTLGMRGGPSSGGFIDTWLGETQFQFPVTGDTFELSQTPVTVAPQNSGGPIYWMALAMLQEYFSADMQLQAAIGFKETMAGTSGPYEQKMSNTDGAYGPFEIESYTYVTQALYYPDLFVDFREDLLKYPDPTAFGQHVMPPADFATFYSGPPTGTLLNSGFVINCMVSSSHVFRRIYDIYANAQDFCFKELLMDGIDEVIAVAALAVAYNRGIEASDPGTNLNADSVFNIDKFEKYLDDPLAHKSLPEGNSQYRDQVLKYCKVLTDASRKAYDDKSVPLFDIFITESDLNTFFFGNGGSVGSQGDGGLLRHFSMDRSAMWADLMTAFNTLADHWNQNPTAISMRYDFLTLLRAVKGYFPVKRALRPIATEATTWMDKRDVPEGECGCDGAPVDETAPYIALKGSAVGNNFTAQFSVKDNQAMGELIWTADRKWETWYYGKKLGGSLTDGEWGFTVPVSELNGGNVVWVGAVDSSGNASIKQFAVKDSGSTWIQPSENAGSPVSDVRITCAVNGNTLNIRFDSRLTAMSFELTLFNCKGSRVVRIFKGKPTGENDAVAVRMATVPSGVYLLQVKAKTFTRVYKVEFFH